MFDFQRLTKRIAIVALATSAGHAVAGGATITDTEFANTDWMLTTFTTGNGGTITGTQIESLGNPVPARDVRNNPNPSGAAVFGFHHFLAGGSIDPSSESVSKLVFTIDRRPTSGLGNFQNFGLAIEQGGVAFKSRTGMGSGGAVAWDTVTQSFSAGDFVRFDGLPGVADFSSSGQPFTVGFWSHSATQPNEGGLNQRVIYDNFRVETSPPQESTLRHAWNFQLNGDDYASSANASPSSAVSFRGQDTGHNVPFEFGHAMHFGTTIASGGTTMIAPTSKIHQFGVENFTIAFWWRSARVDNGNADWLFDAGDSSGWRMQFIGNRLRFTDAAAGTPGIFESPVLTLDGSWLHVAFACDRTDAGTNTWYINGAPVSVHNSAAMTDIVSDHDLVIGGSTSSLEALDGYLDNVRFYSAALTESQVRDLAGANAPVCVGDIDGDDLVTFSDLSLLLNAFNLPCY